MVGSGPLPRRTSPREDGHAMEQRHSAAWSRYFIENGFPDAAPLAAGMEGAVYRLGPELIGKVWARRKPAELLRLQRFYAGLASAGLPFETPWIQEVRPVEGSAVTLERALRGSVLSSRLPAEARLPPEEAIQCLITLLRGLRSAAAAPDMRALPVLDEPIPFWEEHAAWPDALIALMARRVNQFGEQLRAHVEGFELLHERIVARLQGLRVTQLTAIHGDLCGANILVDDALRPTGVLDFGFLTTAGDPAFDASIAAAIFDMYGPHARETAELLTRRLSLELGDPIELLLLYRAAYAVITSNAYDPLGRDGHFAWCVAVLKTPEVRAAVTG